MSHTVKTTIVTSATGEITGYGFCVEAQHNDEPMEIAACITYSLGILRQTIAASFAGLPTSAQIAQIAAQLDPPAEPNPLGDSEGDELPARAAEKAAPAAAGPPKTPAEACTRFYARYGDTIGGQDWASVRRYLRQPRRPEPATVEQWYATAEIVRDYSRPPTGPTRRDYARH